MKKILITGGLGFLGSNLAFEGYRKCYEIIVLDNFFKTDGNIINYKWLKKEIKFIFENKDIRIQNDVEKVIKKYKPDVIFHVAGQVAMTTSIENPRLDFEVNTLGTFNLLESVRLYSPDTIILYSSTNKVYGDFSNLKLEEKEKRYIYPDYPNGFDENITLDFHSPYGCSKGSADQYLLDYHRIFGIKTVVFRHSTMYGGRQFASYDQGWIGWFIEQSLKLKKGEINNISIHGNGKQVRDLLHANDMMNLYYTTLDNIDKCTGNVFNIGGGEKNSLSLIELFNFLEKELNIKIEIEHKEWRESDQKSFIANISKIKKLTGWEPKISKEQGLKDMLKWIESIIN
ncbi:MAG: GDP-mannose 4,6-dehydratase [Candidatus Gracilibacteria bacterium]|nr:GDP-mannose 4,6-dehydratase [Candidatus Gracilibacteria bacterium]